MENNVGKGISKPLVNRGPIGEGSGGRNGKRADRARHWPAMLTSMMIVVSMFVVLGFYATAQAQAASPAAVNLGTAGNFAILAQSGITTTGTTHIWGNIGVSPIAATSMTGFGLVMDASGTFSTSPLVTGNVYAADYAPPTPAMLTTAVSDMQTAYTDAAGRTNPDHTELGAGDITSMTLAPGLYKWGTGLLIGAAGVTLAGGATDVWIFQIAQGLTLASGAHVTLSGGAQASNIFWQVAGQVTLGTTASMKGIILCKTAIVMNTGATLEGRALAQTAVTLDSNTVTAPGAVVLNQKAIDNLRAHLGPNSGMPDQSQKGQQNALNHLLSNQNMTHDSDNETDESGCN